MSSVQKLTSTDFVGNIDSIYRHMLAYVSSCHHQHLTLSLSSHSHSHSHTQLDSVLFAEFLSWREAPSLNRSSAFMGRVYREDIGPCLSFTRTEVHFSLLSESTGLSLSLNIVMKYKCSLFLSFSLSGFINSNCSSSSG